MRLVLHGNGLLTRRCPPLRSEQPLGSEQLQHLRVAAVRQADELGHGTLEQLTQPIEGGVACKLE